MKAVLEHEGVGGVAVEGGRQIEQRETNVVALASIDFRRVGVAELVDRSDDAEDREELGHLRERFSVEVVEVHRALKDRFPVANEDDQGPQGRQDGHENDRPLPDPPNVFHGAIHEPIGIDDMEHDEEDVETFRLLFRLLMAEAAELVQQPEIALGDRLLDELDLSKELLVLEHELDRDVVTGCAGESRADLLPGPASVEEPHDLPLGIPELVILHRDGVLDDPIGLAKLDLPKDAEILAQGRAFGRLAAAGGKSLAHFLGPRRGEKFSGPDGCAQGRNGQSLFQK